MYDDLHLFAHVLQARSAHMDISFNAMHNFDSPDTWT